MEMVLYRYQGNYEYCEEYSTGCMKVKVLRWMFYTRQKWISDGYL